MACERAFSKLKVIKSRLRSTLTQEHLESFMILNIVSELIRSLDYDNIIDALGNHSETLQKTLMI